MSNPILTLKQYIEDHKDDCGGDWEYEHTPHIQYTLEQLNKNQTIEFCDSMLKWSEYHLYELADPILFCSNIFMDSFNLYLRIFSKLSNIENLEYLAQNIGLSLQIETLDKLELKDLEMFLKNMQRVSDFIKLESYGNQYKGIEDTIKLVINNKTANNGYN